MKHPYIHKHPLTPIEYIRKYLKEVPDYYGAHAEKDTAKALEIAFGGLQINDPRIRDIAEALGWTEEYYSIFKESV